MSIFRKLRRVHSYGQYCHIPGFKEAFPELNHLSSEEIMDRWRKIKIDLYQEKQESAEKWIRITLPFAIVLMILMFISLPFKFMITGKWGYDIGEGKIYNWFKKLRLQ